MTKTIRYATSVKVTVDESKFDEAFMSEFRYSFYDFYTLDDHLEHLGQLYARGIADDYSFIEGYGPAKEMGISFDDVRDSTEVEIA